MYKLVKLASGLIDTRSLFLMKLATYLQSTKTIIKEVTSNVNHEKKIQASTSHMKRFSLTLTQPLHVKKEPSASIFLI